MLHVHTAKAVFEIFGKCTKFAVAAVVAVKEEIAVVVERRVDALVAEFVLEAHGVIAATLVAVCFNAEEAVLERKRIVAAVTPFALGQVITDTILTAELVDSKIRHFLP